MKIDLRDLLVDGCVWGGIVLAGFGAWYFFGAAGLVVPGVLLWATGMIATVLQAVG